MILILVMTIILIVFVILITFKRKPKTITDNPFVNFQYLQQEKPQQSANNNPNNPNNDVDKFAERNFKNYITPVQFNVGLIDKTNYKSMGNCNPNILYPINSLEPDYGYKISNNCPCVEFIQPP